jgi:dipeptidyl aminopeptidase/acylaminoacyl peptidase
VPIATVAATAILETAVPETISADYVLFALNDDLWRTGIQGDEVEQLTENKTMNWQMNPMGEWWLAAVTRPPKASPDGRWIALSTGEEVVLIDVRQRTQIGLPGADTDLVAWSHDSNHLAYVPNHARVYVYDLTDQAALPRRLLELSNITSIVWSPDNQYVAIGCCFEGGQDEIHRGQIKQIHATSGQIETVGELWLSLGGGSPPLCWTNENDVKQVELDTDYSSYCSTMPSMPAISPDGNLRAYLQPASPDDIYWSGPSLLVVEDVQTATPLWQRELEENIKILKWSPENDYLFLDNDQLHSSIWRVGIEDSSALEVIVNDGFLLDVIDTGN